MIFILVNNGQRARDLSQDPIILEPEEEDQEVRDVVADRPEDLAANEIPNDPLIAPAAEQEGVEFRGIADDDEEEDELLWESPQAIIVGKPTH